MQRREDIFFAGVNPSDGKTWVLSTGHYMALFDQAWLNMPPTNKVVMIRYAEFHQVTSDVICASGIFLDMVGVMRQAGYDPLPNETGKFFTYPGPKTNDGILLEAQPAHGISLRVF